MINYEEGHYDTDELTTVVLSGANKGQEAQFYAWYDDLSIKIGEDR